jgi:ergothioneine biosynthesis protein EgtB
MNAQPESSFMDTRSETLDARFRRVREATLSLCAMLAPEDTVAQSMPDASPVKWHLAHTTWFFERFVLARDAAYQPFDASWHYLFNSYYQTAGPMHARPQRGLITRPSLSEIVDYRHHVDARMVELLCAGPDADTRAMATIGLHHEQQHQELLLTDIKHLFSCNPLLPAYDPGLPEPPRGQHQPLRFLSGREGIAETGAPDTGFAYDNERPRHRELLQPHRIAQRPVSNGEYLQFIRDGGYRTPTLWLSDGWDAVQREGWERPLYWSDDLQSAFTLAGLREIDPHAPVAHVSFFEADAFARWAGARLPTEAEWEVQAEGLDPMQGNLRDRGLLHPAWCGEAEGEDVPRQLFGDVWEWTSSPYVNYPGFRPLDGTLGEYNGKFMCGQWVMRGGSCVTPADHIRASYRNFFHPASRWQFSGIRLGSDA